MRAKERNDLLISWVTISAAFAWLFQNILKGFIAFPMNFIVIFVICLFTVGLGFIFHEMGHRYMARKFGAHAEYRAWPFGLAFALFGAFIGILFAAPGAVYIYGPHITRTQNGKIAIAGPLINIFIGGVFLSLYLLTRDLSFGSIFYIPIALRLGAYFNFLFAAFNLLPFFILDGKKVFVWNPVIWLVSFIAAGGLWMLMRII